MDDETATEILGRYGDYEDMEEELVKGDPIKRGELAEALAFDWRDNGNDPGFNQPGQSLVSEVEGIIGEPVWPESDDEDSGV
jgi:hypothetical protein